LWAWSQRGWDVRCHDVKIKKITQNNRSLFPLC
jgi:hypothetical protein